MLSCVKLSCSRSFRRGINAGKSVMTQPGKVAGLDLTLGRVEVNLLDLAMVGGNYGKTSANAYSSWTP